jgi:hypothetical protein
VKPFVRFDLPDGWPSWIDADYVVGVTQSDTEPHLTALWIDGGSQLLVVGKVEQVVERLRVADEPTQVHEQVAS